jgi:nitrogen fixation/metabolism regulation signal transduction histidine kinase
MDLGALLAGFAGGILLALVLAWLVTRLREQARDEEARRASPMSAVAEHLPVAVLSYAADGRIRYANRPAEALMFRGESALGKNFLHLLELAPEPVRDALLGSGDTLFTLDHEGETETFQMMRREVVVDAEPHFLLLINPLTREVSRREIDVLKKVIRVISHELNNSLASMASLLGSARFIVERPENLPKLARVIDGLEERTTHLQKFLGEYGALSKLPKPRPREVDLGRLQTHLGELFPGATIMLPVAETGWFDETQVEQALINLLKNAREAGGPEDQVQLVWRQQQNALEIGVLDRGKGFSKEALQHGLLPFFSTKPGGSGVGLALCREVVEGHGGSLRIKAREGGGSAVYLTLPQREQSRGVSSSVALTLTRT